MQTNQVYPVGLCGRNCLRGEPLIIVGKGRKKWVHDRVLMLFQSNGACYTVVPYLMQSVMALPPVRTLSLYTGLYWQSFSFSMCSILDVNYYGASAVFDLISALCPSTRTETDRNLWSFRTIVLENRTILIEIWSFLWKPLAFLFKGAVDLWSYINA